VVRPAGRRLALPGLRRHRPARCGRRGPAHGEELGRAFPGTPVRTSGRDGVLPTVDAEPGARGQHARRRARRRGGYGAVLLLDAWAALGPRRPAGGGGGAAPVVRRRGAGPAGRRRAAAWSSSATAALPAVQALVRWDPAGAAARELADRAALGLPARGPDGQRRRGTPPRSPRRWAALDLPAAADVLGPVAAGDGVERLLLRVPRVARPALAAALKALARVRSARKGRGRAGRARPARAG
jgi:primosomal protein N' (replication factor Y)